MNGYPSPENCSVLTDEVFGLPACLTLIHRFDYVST